MVPKYHETLGVFVKYYSNLAGCRQERKCIMRSKKLAVRFGLLAVLLMSLSLASTSNASTFFIRRVATPEYSWTRTWRGAVIVDISCGTPGATIWYTWNGSSVRTYQRPLYVTRDAVVRAQASKAGWWNSYVNTLTIDFRPYKN
jgi:hypothetical protein